MKSVLFEGSGCALVTPMTQDGKINYDVLEKLIGYQLSHGTSALIVCGSTGEACTLTDVEYASCIRFTAKTAAGRVPVIAGSSGFTLGQALARSRIAQDCGADALLISPPAYLRPPQEGIFLYYRQLADLLERPILLYHVPSRTGCRIEAETALRLSEHPRIAGLKDAGGDPVETMRIRSLCGDDLPLYCGSDTQIGFMLSLGARGVISVASNLIPQKITAFCRAKTVSELARLQTELLPLLLSLSKGTNPVPIKKALCLAGISVGECRAPLSPLSREESEQLADAMRAVGLRAGEES